MLSLYDLHNVGNLGVWSATGSINLLGKLPITMLVSMHDMKLVEELFPRTIVMDEGLILADGDTRQILADEKFLNEHGLEKP